MNNTKNLLITGGLGGIGLEIVKLFYKKKYNIIILDNKKISFFNSLITNINNNNFIKYIKIDLTKPILIKKCFFKIKKEYLSIDVLINCVGIQHVDEIVSFPSIKWKNIIDLNLSSSFYTTKYALQSMKKNNSGRIINIASVHGQVASINKSAYVASKHGMIGLTKTTALETATSNITCNAICPGWVNTELVSKQLDKKIKINKSNRKIEINKLLSDKHPNLKFIPAKAIASLCFYLCSKEASEITGSSINIDGGWTSQ